MIDSYPVVMTSMPKMFPSPLCRVVCPIRIIDALSNRPFTLATRPDELSRKDAEWLVEQGCQGIELNVYTTQQFVLDRNGIFYNLDIIEEMVAFFQEKGLEVGIHLVYGLPHADLEGCINDVRIFCNSMSTT